MLGDVLREGEDTDVGDEEVFHPTGGVVVDRVRRVVCLESDV